eukprot:1484495-Rhodomonas_salina.2
MVVGWEEHARPLHHKLPLHPLVEPRTVPPQLQLRLRRLRALLLRGLRALGHGREALLLRHHPEVVDPQDAVHRVDQRQPIDNNVQRPAVLVAVSGRERVPVPAQDLLAVALLELPARRDLVQALHAVEPVVHAQALEREGVSVRVAPDLVLDLQRVELRVRELHKLLPRPPALHQRQRPHLNRQVHAEARVLARERVDLHPIAPLALHRLLQRLREHLPALLVQLRGVEVRRHRGRHEALRPAPPRRGLLALRLLLRLGHCRLPRARGLLRRAPQRRQRVRRHVPLQARELLLVLRTVLPQQVRGVHPPVPLTVLLREAAVVHLLAHAAPRVLEPRARRLERGGARAPEPVLEARAVRGDLFHELVDQEVLPPDEDPLQLVDAHVQVVLRDLQLVLVIDGKVQRQVHRANDLVLRVDFPRRGADLRAPVSQSVVLEGTDEEVKVPHLQCFLCDPSSPVRLALCGASVLLVFGGHRDQAPEVEPCRERTLRSGASRRSPQSHTTHPPSQQQGEIKAQQQQRKQSTTLSTLSRSATSGVRRSMYSILKSLMWICKFSRIFFPKRAKKPPAARPPPPSAAS